MDRRTLLKLMATHALLSAGRPSSALANPDSIHTGLNRAGFCGGSYS